MTNQDSLKDQLNDNYYLLENSSRLKNELIELKAISIKDLSQRMSRLEENNIQLSYSDYISGLSLLLTLLTTISLVSYFFYGKNKKRQLRLRQYLTGKWTTEGDLTSPQPQPYLDFELEVDPIDGEITGIFNTNNDNYPIVLSINGKLKKTKVNIEITHFTHQGLLTYGEVKLRIEGKLLKWSLKRGESELFPNSATVKKI